MNSMRILLLLLAVFIQNILFTQTPGLNKSILLSAETQKDPARITLKWQPIAGSTSFKIYRKTLNSNQWGFPVASNLPGNTLSWIDQTVEPGVAYEYRINSTGTVVGSGYILTGIELPEVFARGKVLLVYDTISTSGLDAEITRWKNDVVGDGFQVISIPVNQSDAVTTVKENIRNIYLADPENTKTLFLLGRVPVPYSGMIVPDGHTPDHYGAWPADGYYAEMNGVWTDNSVNITGASTERNRNVPGDGKFDQSNFPSDLELAVGRADMHNLPAFNEDETTLLKNYLDKNHAFRNKLFAVENRALVDDEFPGYAEGFSAGGWRNFSALCGYDRVFAKDYQSTLKSDNYLWSYGCGAGNFINCSGVIGTPGFVQDSIQTIFTMLFGSYFGDWDSPENNLMRAAIARGSVLTNCWAGRPYWYFHHMGLGQTIGHSTLASMNNSVVYDFNNSQKSVHMALMGDPTLRAHPVEPVSELYGAATDGLVLLNWTSDGEDILGFHIFRKSEEEPVFTKINNELVIENNFVDSCIQYPGTYTYMVRAVKLENTNSGSYFNMSTGKMLPVTAELARPLVSKFTFVQDGFKVSFTNQSVHAESYLWDFGDGTTSEVMHPQHEYAQKGTYTVTLIAISPCGQVKSTGSVVVLIGNVEANVKDWSVFPNPVFHTLELTNLSGLTPGKFSVFDLKGNKIINGNLDGKNTLDVSFLPSGVYVLNLDEPFFIRKKFVKM
jgi:hypothetical protein